VCRIVSVCNLDVRKFLVTFPNLGYWLSEIPLNLRSALARLCCTPLTFRQVQFGNQAAPQNVFSAAAPPSDTADIAAIAALAFSRRANPADMQTLAMASLGLTDGNNQPFLTAAELRHPLETLLLNQLGVPVLEAFLGKSQDTLSSSTGAQASTQPQDLKKEVDDLRARLQDAQTKLNNLADKIK
jgi:hypothetical protein